jgi:hypothetical protein
MSTIATTVAIISLLKVKKAEESTKRVGDRSRSAKHTAQQSIEITISSLITSNRLKMEEAENALRLFKQQYPDQSDEFRNKIYLESIDEYLKTFDKACLMYLDERFDKDKFIKEYKKEITKIIEQEHFYSKLLEIPNPESRYRAIQRVYDKWENIEK